MRRVQVFALAHDLVRPERSVEEAVGSARIPMGMEPIGARPLGSSILAKTAVTAMSLSIFRIKCSSRVSLTPKILNSPLVRAGCSIKPTFS